VGIAAVSTFYLLPSRPALGQRFAGYLARLFPGLEWSKADWGGLGDLLGGVVAGRSDVYVVYGEELAAGEDTATALREVFGAVEGDVVVELRPGDEPGELATWSWQVGEDSAP
jgi:hypothetical protein